MKKEIRVIGIDDAPFDKFKDKEVLLVGAVFRGGGLMDGVLSSKVEVDGEDSTSRIITMINSCKFKPQLQAIILDGIAFGGFNIVDINELNIRTGIPVIVVIRRHPDLEKIKDTLIKICKKEKYKMLEKAGDVHKIKNIYVQIAGASAEYAEEILDITCTRSFIPEPVRAAHLIGAGVILGESKGNA